VRTQWFSVWKDAPAAFGPGFVGVEVDGLVLQRAPQTLDDDVVAPPAAAVHGDAHVSLLEHGTARGLTFPDSRCYYWRIERTLNASVEERRRVLQFVKIPFACAAPFCYSSVVASCTKPVNGWGSPCVLD